VRIESYSDGEHEWFLASDEGSPKREDFVLGAGGASQTLASLVPRIPVASAVDIGCGSGVQSLHLTTHAARVVATDLNPRALEFAAETARRSGVTFDLRLGSLYEPIAHETFDLVVSNPPFVISPKARFIYRDGGMAGDEISRLLISNAAQHLNLDGWFVALANWVIEGDRDWRERLTPWLVENEGCDAWVVQREVQRVEEYVDLWLKDSGDNERVEFQGLRQEWLAYFREMNVREIGFGWVVLHKSGRDLPWRRLEEIRHEIDAPLGDWVLKRFAGFDLAHDLDDEELLALRLERGSDVVLDGGRIRQRRGWRISGAIDEIGASIVSAASSKESIGAVIAQVAPWADPGDFAAPIRALVAEGFLLPL